MRSKDQLNIVAPTRYPWLFNGPRSSRHNIHRRPFAPMNRIDYRLEGVTVLSPLPPVRADLVHAFNRIPLGTTPYIIGFESHLPRAFGMEGTAYYRALLNSLAGDRCQRIVAISDCARNIFLDCLSGRANEDAIVSKLEVRLPNLPVPDEAGRLEISEDGAVHVVFIGAHFARKGGLVALRLADLALEAGFPLHVHIVSALEVGTGIWTDPQRAGFYDAYWKLLELPNVSLMGALPNRDVVDLVARSHFSLLTTFGDTFGYSALEAMSQGTPVIATAQGALPEFIEHGSNGVLLDLETNPHREWVHTSAKNRDTPAFEAMFSEEVERLAVQSLDAIKRLASDPKSYADMRKAAHRTMLEKFRDRDANEYWDDLYSSLHAARRR